MGKKLPGRSPRKCSCKQTFISHLDYDFTSGVAAECGSQFLVLLLKLLRFKVTLKTFPQVMFARL